MELFKEIYSDIKTRWGLNVALAVVFVAITLFASFYFLNKNLNISNATYNSNPTIPINIGLKEIIIVRDFLLSISKDELIPEQHKAELTKIAKILNINEAQTKNLISYFEDKNLENINLNDVINQSLNKINDLEKRLAKALKENKNDDDKSINYLITKAQQYINDAEYDKAEKTLKDIDDELDGQYEKQTEAYNKRKADNFASLADISQLKFDYLGASNYYKQASEFSKGIDKARYLYKTAFALNIISKYDEALELYQEFLQITEDIIGKQTKSYANTLSNIAGIYQAKGKYNEALKLYKEALQIIENTIGKQTDSYTSVLNNIALIYYAKDKYDDALELYEEALQITEDTIGKQTEFYANTLNNIALIYYAKGKYNEALKLYEKSYDIFYSLFGTKHPKTMLVKDNLQFIQK